MEMERKRFKCLDCLGKVQKDSEQYNKCKGINISDPRNYSTNVYNNSESYCNIASL